MNAESRCAPCEKASTPRPPPGGAVAAIMATLAELELELGRERRAASCHSRRARRLPVTKPPKLNRDRQEQLRRLAATGEPVHELANAFGIRRATAYRYLSGPSTAPLLGRAVYLFRKTQWQNATR